MTAPEDALLERLRALPGTGPVVGALAGEPGVHAVGGAVRDLLLDREPRELDLVVEGDVETVAERAATRLGGAVVTRHERFGTATVCAPGATVDLAAARRERYARPGALPDVELGATLADDLARRDFAVNAMAVALDDGRVTAVPGAREDLAAGRLRVLHDGSFTDDPTRLLRLARYAARLGFDADPATARLAAAAVAGGAPETVTGPRLGAELRLLLAEPQPAALSALGACGLGEALLGGGFEVDPGLAERALALAPPDARAGAVALATSVLALAPGALGGRLDRLGLPADERDAVVESAARAGGLGEELRRLGPAAAPSFLWRLLRRERPETVALAGALGGEPAAAAAASWLGELRHVRAAIDGRDLLAAGLSGPAVGRGLDAALAAALDGRAPDREAQLRAALAAAG